MSGLQGWNKCDDCGRFAKPEEMRFEERRWLTMYGDLREEYPQFHKEGFGCNRPDSRTVATTNT